MGTAVSELGLGNASHAAAVAAAKQHNDAEYARLENDAERHWEAAIQAGTPGGSAVGSKLLVDGEEGNAAREAAYAAATEYQLRGMKALDRLLDKQKRGVLLKPNDKDVNDSVNLFSSTAVRLQLATHGATGVTLDKPDALMWLATAHFQLAQVQTVVPALHGARVALSGGVPNIDSLPARQNLQVADKFLMEARQHRPDASTTKSINTVQQSVVAQTVMLNAAVYAGLINAMADITSAPAMTTEDGKPLPEDQLVKLLTIRQYADLARRSLPLKENSAAGMRAWVEVPPQEWANKIKSMWAPQALAAMKLGNPRVDEAVKAGTQMIEDASRLVR